MNFKKFHSFFIPVMGTGFTIDTPLHVAKYGISSVISLVDDLLIERIRNYYCSLHKKSYKPITNSNNDPRANRITAYLNLVNDIVKKQIKEIKNQTFSKGTELQKYFDLLPETSSLKKEYLKMITIEDPKEKKSQQEQLKKQITAGSIDVNIMTKLDRDNYRGNKKLASEFSDALSALRGYAQSDLCSGIVFSAGLNKMLYSYLEHFDDFYPQADGHIQKQIIIKVSDYRSALTQGKLLARKGLWVSEFRVESGLNCGGHAFPTKGNLLGPVLQEFKDKKNELFDTLYPLFKKGLQLKGKTPSTPLPSPLITVQGGIATANENSFLRDYYNVDATGWGTPFLMVPEATSVDKNMLEKLATATENDVYMSNVSPLNIIFQNLRTSASEIAKRLRIKNNKPGSACPKGYLAFNTEFTEKPICTASRQYQTLKIEQLNTAGLDQATLEKELKKVMEKSCVCHELGGTALIKHNIEKVENFNSAICPGPNIAYFSKIYSLTEMAAHIYGKINLLHNVEHPNMFITELKLYLEILKHIVTECMHSVTEKESQYIKTFYENLLSGMEYYKNLISSFIHDNEQYREKITKDLMYLKERLEKIIVENNISFTPQKVSTIPITASI